MFRSTRRHAVRFQTRNPAVPKETLEYNRVLIDLSRQLSDRHEC
jgi:hypothetical protein